MGPPEAPRLTPVLEFPELLDVGPCGLMVGKVRQVGGLRRHVDLASVPVGVLEILLEEAHLWRVQIRCEQLVEELRSEPRIFRDLLLDRTRELLELVLQPLS